MTDLVVLNIQGMDPSINSMGHWKLPYLIEYIEGLKQFTPVISLTESWLKEHITNAQIMLPNYQILRSDRKNRSRGGTLLYIHNDFPITNSHTFDDETCGAVVCNIDSLNIIIASVYRPPDCMNESFSRVTNFLQSHIDSQAGNKHKNILVVGDFNLPHLTWSEAPSTQYPTSNNKECAQTLLSFMNQNFLCQYVEKPTRLNNILDLVLSNDIDLVKEIQIKDTELSDHRMVTIKSSLNCKPTVPPKRVFEPHTFRNLNFYKADYQKLNEHLETIQWDELKSLCDPQDFPELVRLVILQVSELYAPTKCFKSKSNRLSAYRRHRRTLNRKKRKLYKVLETKELTPLGIQNVKEKIVNIHDDIKDSFNEESRKSEQEAVNKIKEDPKYFYTWSKRKLKHKTNIGPHTVASGHLQHDEKIMSDLLQTQFCSVFSNPEEPSKRFTNITANFEKPLDSIQITIDDVDKALKKLKANSSAGEDDIPAALLTKCSSTLNYPLYLMWKDSLENVHIHPRFKEQIIAPIHKKGSKSVAANYRPICPTSHSIKTCERIVFNKILDHFTSNNLMCKHQHGFLPQRSCLTQLLSHINTVFENLLQVKDTDSIYLDYAKAFDKVDHEILLYKLRCYGITGKLLAWIKEFLQGRTQCVAINGTKSFKSAVKSGVPQGTVLGPLLFLIYVNDINHCITESFVSCFADDTRIKKGISAAADVMKLQEDLNHVVSWSSDNNMSLHQDKFEYMNHSCGDAKLLKHLPFTSEFYEYTTPSGAIITPKDTIRDLGVLISSDLSWGPHISNITDAARKMCSWILSVFATRDELTMMTLYNSLVRSRVEFCCPLWHTNKVEDIIKIESIQRTFTSKIEGYSDFTYWERLIHLRLMSLQRRRERYILLHLFKVLHDTAPNDPKINFTTSDRRGVLAVVPTLSRTAKPRIQSMYDSSFAVLAPRLWNSLPKKIRQEETFGKFKTALTRYCLAIPDEPPISGAPSGNSLLQWTGHHEGLMMG